MMIILLIKKFCSKSSISFILNIANLLFLCQRLLLPFAQSIIFVSLFHRIWTINIMGNKQEESDGRKKTRVNRLRGDLNINWNTSVDVDTMKTTFFRCCLINYQLLLILWLFLLFITSDFKSDLFGTVSILICVGTAWKEYLNKSWNDHIWSKWRTWLHQCCLLSHCDHPQLRYFHACLSQLNWSDDVFDSLSNSFPRLDSLL